MPVGPERAQGQREDPAPKDAPDRQAARAQVGAAVKNRDRGGTSRAGRSAGLSHRKGKESRSAMCFLRLLAILVIAASVGAQAQPSGEGNSRLHVGVQPHRIEMAFAFGPSALARIKATGDGAMAAFVRDYMHIEINGAAFQPEILPSTPDRLVLVRESTETVTSLGLSLSVFEVLGDRQRIDAEFEQGGAKYPVTFTVFEPDYLYETGWSDGGASWRQTWTRGMGNAWSSGALLGGIAAAMLGWRFVLTKTKKWVLALLLGGLGFLGAWCWLHPVPAAASGSAWHLGQAFGLLIMVAVASPLLLLSRLRG